MRTAATARPAQRLPAAGSLRPRGDPTWLPWPLPGAVWPTLSCRRRRFAPLPLPARSRSYDALWEELTANERLEFFMLEQGDSHEVLQRKFLQGAGLTTERDNAVLGAQMGT